MSDKETAPTIPRLALQIRNLAHLAWTDRKSAEYLFREIGKRAQKISEIAVECAAPAPQLQDALSEIGKIVLSELPEGVGFIFRADLVREVLQKYAATPQVTPELELEQEADGRWLAEFTRFPGVAAYGPSKEEAIRNAAKVLIESEQQVTPAKGPLCDNCGKPSREHWCWIGLPKDENENYAPSERRGTSEPASPREFKPYMEDHEYYDPPQASPTPDKCPKCGSDKVWIALPRCHGGTKLRDPWHSSAPKGTK